MKDFWIKGLFSLGITLLVCGMVLTPSILHADNGEPAFCTGCNLCGNAHLNPNGSGDYICGGVWPSTIPYCTTTGNSCTGCTGECGTYTVEIPPLTQVKCGCAVGAN